MPAVFSASPGRVRARNHLARRLRSSCRTVADALRPGAQNMLGRLQPPSAEHWFGTDEFGRDIFARIIYGARTTLYIIMLVTIIVAPIGLLIGVCAGYLGGWADEILMRVTDVFLSLPGLVLALGFAAALGPGITNAIIAIALTAWPPIARLARAEALSLRQADFIAAVRLQGASRSDHFPPCPAHVPSLGDRAGHAQHGGRDPYGGGARLSWSRRQPPMPEWGAMVSTGREFMIDSPWVVIAPGIAIAAVSLAFNLVGDALRDTLDPRGGG